MSEPGRFNPHPLTVSWPCWAKPSASRLVVRLVIRQGATSARRCDLGGGFTAYEIAGGSGPQDLPKARGRQHTRPDSGGFRRARGPVVPPPALATRAPAHAPDRATRPPLIAAA